MIDKLIQLTASDAVQKLRSGDISPLDMISAAEKRIAEVEPAINAFSLGIFYYISLKLKENYLLENWKLLLAFLLPGFFLSTALESLVVNFSVFKADLSLLSNKINALEIP